MYIKGATSRNRDANPRSGSKDRADSRYRAAQKVVKYAQGHRDRAHGQHAGHQKHG